MTLVMAEKEQPVFRDFLGIGYRDDVRQGVTSSDIVGVSQTSAGFDDRAEANGDCGTRASSANSGRLETCTVPGNVAIPTPLGIAIPCSSDPGSGWPGRGIRGASGTLNHGTSSAFYKLDTDSRPEKRELAATRESLQERLQMSVEALEAGRPPKQPRIGDRDFASSDELRLSMQPPRPSPKQGPSWLQSPTVKPDASPSRSIKRGLDRVKSFTNGGSSQRLSHLGAPDRASREHNVSPVLSRPAADEGSRTGLQGPGIGSLINGSIGAPTAGGSAGPDLTRRPKVARSTGSDSVPPSSRPVTAPASRQLTIFYGGQAHVFDDVPPDKADAIMALAGSNGRSWSTTYSPRPTNSMQTSASEGSLPAHGGGDREKDKCPRGQSVSNGGNLGLTSEVQTLLRGLAQSGIGSMRPGQLPAIPVPNYPATYTDVRGAQDWVGNDSKKENSNVRGVPRPMPCPTDPVHDGGSASQSVRQSQPWM